LLEPGTVGDDDTGFVDPLTIAQRGFELVWIGAGWDDRLDRLAACDVRRDVGPDGGGRHERRGTVGGVIDGVTGRTARGQGDDSSDHRCATTRTTENHSHYVRVRITLMAIPVVVGDADVLVKASDVCVHYGSTVALAPSSFGFTRGSAVALVGSNGSGK